MEVRLFVNQYSTNTGIRTLISNESQAGGFPTITGGAACTDTDHDGMSDAWEMAHGLNPNLASDGNLDRNGDGYTNLEAYLYGMAEGSGSANPPPAAPSGVMVR